MSKAKSATKTQKKKLHKANERYQKQLESVFSDSGAVETEAGNHRENEPERMNIAELEAALVEANTRLAAAREHPTPEVVTHDITVPQTVEETQRLSEERYRLMLDSSPDPIVIYDLNGNVVEVNPAFSETFGWQKEELLGKRIDFVPEESREETRGFIQSILRDEPVKAAETKRFTKNGQVLNIQLSASLIKDYTGKTVGNIVILRDITYQKRAEGMLRQSQQQHQFAVESANARLLDAIESMDAGIVMYSADERLVVCNTRYKELYSRSAHLMVPGTPYESILRESYRQGNYTHTGLSEDEWVASRLAMHRAAGSQGPYEQQVGQRWIRISDTRASDGGIVSLRTDITETKHAEQALSESEERFHVIAEALPTAVMISRFGDGKILYTNSAFKKIFGYDDQSIVGKATPDIYYDVRERPALLAKIRDQGGHLHNEELRTKNSNGKLIWSVINITPIRYGDEDCLLSDLVDITNRKQAEESFRQLSIQNRLILESATEGVFGLDPEGRHTFVNPAAAKMLGYSVEELIGERSHELWHHTRADGTPYPHTECHIYATLHDGKARQIDTEVFWRKDGTSFSVEYTSNSLLNEAGEIIGGVIVFRDITERLKDQEALQISHADLAAWQEAINTAAIVAITDVQGKIEYANDNFCKISKYSREELIGQDHRLINSGHHSKEFIREVWVTIANGKTWRGEFRNRAKDGSIYWVDTTITPILNAQGKPVKYMAVRLDITARKQAEVALRESESQFRTLIENAPEAIVVVDIETGLFADPNENATHLYGLDREALIKVGPADMSPPTQPDGRPSTEAAMEKIGQALNGEKPVFEWMHRNAQGVDIPCEVRLVRLPTARPLVRASVTNIAERKRAEEELLKFKMGIEQSNDAIFITNTDGTITYMNPGFEKVYGFTREETLGKTPRIIKSGLIPQEQYKGFWDALLSKNPVVGEIVNKTKEGRLINIDGANSPIVDAGGKVIGFLAIHHDATERKQSEAILAKRAAELQAVAEVSTTASVAPNVQQMLQSVVDLTKERFDLYHAHIYIVDALGENLVLSAGAGDVGKQMVARGHSIPLNRPHSLVARAARTRHGSISNDVTQEPDFLPNPLLPNTRSELATPIIVGDAVLGVFDVQSEVTGRFSDEDIAIQTTMAQQLGAALQNARSLERAETLVAELNDLTRGMVREGWTEYKTRELSNESFVYDLALVSKSTDTTAMPEIAADAIATQLAVRGEVIGELAVVEPQMIAEAHQITEAIAQRLSAHIENLRLNEQTQAALGQTESLYKASRRLTGAANLQEMVAAVAEGIPLRGINRAILVTFEYDPQGEMIATVVRANWHSGVGHPPTAIGTRYPTETFGSMNIMLSPTPVFIEDAQTDERLDSQIKEVHRSHNTHAIAVLPLMSGRHLGALVLQSEEQHRFTEQDTQPFVALAGQMTVAIERQRLLDETQKHAAELEAVAQVTTATSTILERDRLLESAVHLTQRRFKLYHCHVFLFDHLTNNLGIIACGWREGDTHEGSHGKRLIHLTQERSLVARAARDREPVLVNSVTTDPTWLPNELLPETQSELAIPMVVGNELVGVFDVQSEVAGRFTEEDVRTFSTLANAIAVAVQNANLYAEQTAAVARLKELDQLKSSFLANMSHELRTPLNSIIGFTEVLLEGIDGDLTESMDNDLKVIHKNGQHLLNLINDVLDMAKIEAGRMTLTIEEFNLQEVLEEVTDITRPLADNKSLELRLDIDPKEDLTLEADRIRMRQVMINVVNNSIKFTESGYVAISARRADELIQVVVRDTGIGIPPEQIDKIFQEFTQVDTSTTRKAGGTGLGLPISRHLVELHGGHLWAESSGIAGEGSFFYIELPIIAARQTE